MGLYRKHRTALCFTVVTSRCINAVTCHQGVSLRHINDAIQTDFKSLQYIKAHTISQRLRDRVAGAFVKKDLNVTPLQCTAISTQLCDAATLKGDWVMDNTPRSLLGNFFRQPSISSAVIFFDYMPPSSGEKLHPEHWSPLLTRLRKGYFPIHGERSFGQSDVFQTGVGSFSQTSPLFSPGDNRETEFSDMGSVSSLISHKTAKNGIPAVRTIAFGKLSRKGWDLSKQYYRKCRCFLLDVADGYAHGALKFIFNAPISTPCF